MILEERCGAPIKLGIAGLGLAGAFMIRAARNHPHFILAAGMDPLPRPRAAFVDAFNASGYEDFDSLCKDKEIEAVYIASPHRFHAKQTITALEHGKHVLVEKPLALNVRDCEAVVRATEKTGYKVVVGHSHAFDPNVRAMRKIIESGDLGRLIMILSFNYTDYLYRPHAEDEFKAGTGGGITFNQVTHQVEIARLLAGTPIRSISARVSALDIARPAEGCCMAFLQFQDGVTASLTYSGYDFFDSDEFHYWVAEGGASKKTKHGATRQAAIIRQSETSFHENLGFGGRSLPIEQPFLPHFGVWIVTCERGDLRLSTDGLLIYGEHGVKSVPVDRGEGRPGQGDALDALWNSVRGAAPVQFNANWGKATVETLVALKQSSQDGREIFLPP